MADSQTSTLQLQRPETRVAEWFPRDVEHHTLTVLRDDGLYRHLRCAKPSTYCMSFDVLTWPGHLCYTGDMGTFVFSRLPDMFEFFRGTGGIDFSYWGEKAVAVDKPDGIRQYSEARFRCAVKDDFDEFVKSNELSPVDASELWGLIVDDVLSYADNEHGARSAAIHFRCHEPRGREVFPDFWEHRLDEHTTRFVWCCLALRWAIAQYDESRAVAIR